MAELCDENDGCSLAWRISIGDIYEKGLMEYETDCDVEYNEMQADFTLKMVRDREIRSTLRKSMKRLKQLTFMLKGYLTMKRKHCDAYDSYTLAKGFEIGRSKTKVRAPTKPYGSGLIAIKKVVKFVKIGEEGKDGIFP